MARNTQKRLSETESRRPLSALLSQVLVAYTVELDCEFERRMAEAGYPAAALSLRLWYGLMRFLGEGAARVKDLEEQAAAAIAPAKFQLGCAQEVGAAARKRVRDLVAQTEEFRRDPANALPQYPPWDMNGGFGP